MDNLVKNIIGLQLDMEMVNVALGNFNKNMKHVTKVLRSHNRSIFIIELLGMGTAAACLILDERVKKLEKEMKEIKGEQVADNTDESLGQEGEC